MALNPIVYTEKVVRSFLRYQLTAYPFADERLLALMRTPLSLASTPLSDPGIAAHALPARAGEWTPESAVASVLWRVLLVATAAR